MEDDILVEPNKILMEAIEELTRKLAALESRVFKLENDIVYG